MSYIKFNNKCSTDYNLKIENIPNFTSANKEYNEIQIDGRDGTLTINKGYKNISLKFDFVFVEREHNLFIRKKNQIIAWLNNNTNNKLYYSMYDGYYIVKKANISEFFTTSKCVRRFTVEFTVHPFLYQNTDSIELLSKGSIYNIGSRPSNPLIEVYGTGNITIYINNQTVVLKEIEDTTYIDSEIMNCYKLVNSIAVNTNDKMYTKFPTLDVGINNISWIGNVTKIIINGRWCNL